MSSFWKNVDCYENFRNVQQILHLFQKGINVGVHNPRVKNESLCKHYKSLFEHSILYIVKAKCLIVAFLQIFWKEFVGIFLVKLDI